MGRRFKLLSGIFICLSAIFLMSHNTYAVQLGIDVEPNWVQYTFQPYWTYTSSGEVGHKTGYELALSASAGANFVYSVNRVRLNVPAGMALNKGGYLVYSFRLDNFQLNDSMDGNFISACVVNQGSLNSSLHVLDVEYQSTASTGYLVNVYLTNNSAIEGSNSDRYFEISSCSNSNELLYLKPAERIIFTEANFYKLKSDTNYSGSINDVKNAINSLNSNINSTNRKLDNISENQEERAQKEDEAIDNIDNQTPSDIDDGNASNTQNIIGALQSFLSALQNLQATNCNVDLAFPSFAGGTRTVNICQNKEFTGNIVSIVGSVILVFFYLPLAFAMCRLIYNEIRSFTNG